MGKKVNREKKESILAWLRSYCTSVSTFKDELCALNEAKEYKKMASLISKKWEGPIETTHILQNSMHVIDIMRRLDETPKSSDDKPADSGTKARKRSSSDAFSKENNVSKQSCLPAVCSESLLILHDDNSYNHSDYFDMGDIGCSGVDPDLWDIMAGCSSD